MEQIRQEKGRIRLKGPWEKPCQFGCNEKYPEGEKGEHLKTCPAYQNLNARAEPPRRPSKPKNVHHAISEPLPQAFSEQFRDSDGRFVEWGAFYFRFAAYNRTAVKHAYEQVRNSFHAKQQAHEHERRI